VALSLAMSEEGSFHEGCCEAEAASPPHGIPPTLWNSHRSELLNCLRRGGLTLVSEEFLKRVSDAQDAPRRLIQCLISLICM